MNDRPPDRYREQREHRRRSYMNAASLRDQFPHVEQVVLELSFIDHSGHGTYSAQTLTFSPGAHAFFDIPCPSSMCTGGGFDLRSVISRLVARGGSETTGKLDCMGRQSADQNDTHRALLQLDYRVNVIYRA